MCVFIGVWHVHCVHAMSMCLHAMSMSVFIYGCVTCELSVCTSMSMSVCASLFVCNCAGFRTEGAVHSFRDTVFIFRQNILLRYSLSLLSSPHSVSVRQSHYPLLSWLPSSRLSTSLGPVGKLEPRGQVSKFIYYLSQLYLVSLAPRMVNLSNEPDITPKWPYKLSISIAAKL